VTVGGTDLVTASAAGAWSSETAWVDGGGGISPHSVAIPAWQKLAGVINSTNKGSTTLRNGPDVSANANFTFYVCADQTTCTANSYGGTSFAAPMWAGYVALVNQQLAVNSQPAIGFINPTIYAQNVSGGALSAAYAANFHDITSGTSGSYSAVKGYDLVTGWGSPNSGLFSALTGAVPTSGFSLSATAVSIVQGTSGASTVTSTPFGGYGSKITLSVSGLTSGVTVSYGTNPFGPSGSTTISFIASPTAATGTSSVTVTGTGGDGTVQTTTVSLTVTAAPGSFTIAANPTSLSITRGASGSSKITTTVTQGSISSIALSASGQGRGTTISFSPSSIAGTGTSTMRVTVSRTATTGSFNLVVKGTGGGNSHTVTIPLTVH
jgi:kumamolisin